MAKALLAKLYLNWGVYTNPITSVTASTPNEKLNECVAICDDIILSGLFDVGQGYRKKFFPDNGVQIKDFIYAMPMDP
ncbi:MAG: RagB/SusD family nutrient uptake outer membrane protein, partial [Muribaculaceae bacterium]|nr:RagB/SusD family nutrient uptake outer membrane protein [Muribaculaceae bacterium]